jgi:putative membrane protein
MTAILVHWVLAAALLVATAYIVPGIELNSFIAAMVAAVIVGMVNAVIWPLLTILTLPLTIVTFGLFLFVVNGLCLKLAAALTPGFTINGFMPAVIGSIVLTVLGWALRFVFFPEANHIQ